MRPTVVKLEDENWKPVVGDGGIATVQAEHTSIVIDGNNVPYVVYKNMDNDGKVTVMRFDGANWTKVDNNLGFAGSGRPTIAIVGNNVPYVVYSDKNNGGRPTVMKFNGANWIPVGGNGVIAPVRAEHPSIAIDKYGVPYVVYSDMDNDGKVTVMKYAR